MLICAKSKTIANRGQGLLDCRVRCSTEMTIFPKSENDVRLLRKMSQVRPSTACRGE